MGGGGSRARRWRRALLSFLLWPGLVVTTQAVSTSPATAASTVTLRVVIESVVQQGCTDNLSGSDFYARTTIDGTATDFGEIGGDDEIEPGWTATKVLDVDTTSSAAVQIELAESDGFLNFEDDVCDISPQDGTDLDLTVQLIPCAVSGEASGACGVSISTTGNDEGDGDADLDFRVEVDLPPDAPGAAVRCTHTPLWPQPGDDVTITVESLSGGVQVGDTVADQSNAPSPPPALADRKEIADDLEVWVTETDSPDLKVHNKATDRFVVQDVPAGDLVYACRVRDGGDLRFTGWRRTRVGDPAEGAAVPVSFTGDRANRVDVVLVADTDSYTGTDDPDFLADAAHVIHGAYYGQDWFLDNQQWFNFWLADQTGDADNDSSGLNCTLVAPANWAIDYTWRDTGAILHQDAFRDCASNGLFSAEPTSLGTVLHETGHAPFDLADEYCCNGGYFETDERSNMWDTRVECETDAQTLAPPRPASACRTITDTRPTPDRDWHLSEPTPNDLMNTDRRPPQAADLRRMDWFIDECEAGRC